MWSKMNFDTVTAVSTNLKLEHFTETDSDTKICTLELEGISV